MACIKAVCSTQSCRPVPVPDPTQLVERRQAGLDCRLSPRSSTSRSSFLISHGFPISCLVP